MYCLTCDAEKHPVQTFTTKGFVDACPTCQTVFARRDPETPTEQPAPPAPVAVASRPAAKPAEPENGDTIVGQLRARLAFVEAEIAARVKYETERDRLRRMLAAAAEDDAPLPALAAPLN